MSPEAKLVNELFRTYLVGDARPPEPPPPACAAVARLAREVDALARRIAQLELDQPPGCPGCGGGVDNLSTNRDLVDKLSTAGRAPAPARGTGGANGAA